MNARLAERAPALVDLVALGTYVATAAPNLASGDSNELAAIGAAGGVPHPSGYPLFVLWLRATQWLPAGSPSHRAALATALLGGLGVALLRRACMAWGADRWTAAVVALLYASSPLAWRLATEPEVFALNVALALAILCVAAPGRSPAPARLGALGLLAGLGLSNHLTIALLFPVGLLAAVDLLRRTPRRGLALALGLGGLALGLTPYAYLLHAARHAPAACVWGNVVDARALVRHFLRSDFGSFSLAARGEPAPGKHLAFLATTFGASWLWLPLLGALARRPRRPDRFTVALLAAVLCSGPLLVSRFNLSTDAMRFTVERFHLLPVALAAVLGARLASGVAFGAPLRAGALALVAIVALVRAPWTSPAARGLHSEVLEHYLANALRTLPRDAILVTTPDELVGGMMYVRCATDVRPDVGFVSPRMLAFDWYPAHATQELGFAVRPTLDAVAFLQQLVDTGRPVFLSEWFLPGLERKVPSYPLGPLIRVQGPGERIPTPRELFARNEELTRAFVLEPQAPPPGSLAGARYRTYARPWLTLAEAFERDGDLAMAARCRDLAARY